MTDQLPGRAVVGAMVRAARQRSGLSVRDLEQLLGVAHPTVTEIEQGARRIPPRLLEPLALHAEMDRGELVAAWIDAEGAASLALPEGASPLARQVFAALVVAWPDLARSTSPAARGTLAVLRWALARPL